MRIRIGLRRNLLDNNEKLLCSVACRCECLSVDAAFVRRIKRPNPLVYVLNLLNFAYNNFRWQYSVIGCSSLVSVEKKGLQGARDACFTMWVRSKIDCGYFAERAVRDIVGVLSFQHCPER